MNNKGLSLVELLVAMAVSTLVLVGLAYLMINVLHIFGRTNANVELQNESQTAMNLVIDNIMDARGLCLSETAPEDIGKEAVCILLGEIRAESISSVTFTGDAVIWDPAVKEMYLKSYTAAIIDTTAALSEADAARLAAEEIKESVLALSQKERRTCLMARYVAVFDLKTADYCQFPAPEEIIDPEEPVDSFSEDRLELNKKQIDYYKEPIALSLHMEFELEYQNGQKMSREMSEDISLRNRLNHIYLKRESEVGMKKYYRK